MHLILGAMNAVPALGVAAYLGTVDSMAQRHGLGLLFRIELPAWCAVVAAFIVLDGYQYAAHVLMHKVPILWRLHAVHHHAEHVESTTAFRFHTLEIVAHGALLALPLAVLGVRVHDLALYNAVLLPMNLFHHANTQLPRRLERLLASVIVTPGLPRLHHARWQPLTDRNYGAVLSMWDRIFGTSAVQPRPEWVPVGPDGFDPAHTGTLRGDARHTVLVRSRGAGVPTGRSCSRRAVAPLRSPAISV